MVVRRSRPREDGAAALEFALVSPLLFALLFGIIQYGFLFFQMQAASSVARNAVRWAAVGIPSCASYKAAVDADAAKNGVPKTAPTWKVITAYTPAGAGATTVTVTLDFKPTSYLPFVPTPSKITRAATARVEDTSNQAFLPALTSGCTLP